MADATQSGRAPARAAGYLVAGLALAIAAASARPYPGGWNDASRLATVESLVDHGTWAIDQSLFGLMTSDKMFIEGRFYSDKSPVPALAMAGCYEAMQALTGLTAREHPAAFSYWMTLASSGLAYVLAAWCIFRLAAELGLPAADGLLLAASFGLATVALPYTRHVNNHMMLLGVLAALMLSLQRLAREIETSGPRSARLARQVVLAGTLTGIGYTIDLGVGPVLVVAASVLVAYRCRGVVWLAAFGLAMLPWLALHHVLNYQIGGTWAPANASPAHFAWPGSPFDPANMTGAGWSHESLPRGALYAAAMLLGKRGLVTHSLPLLLAVPGLVVLWRRRPREWPEIVFAAGASAGTWLLYSATSNNYSGVCCSIRWFVPLLAPAYYMLAVAVREQPHWRSDLLVLSGAGGLLGWVLWWYGPWHARTGSFLWPLVAGGLVAWWWCARRREMRAGRIWVRAGASN